jgi:hypothetical protein
LKDKPLLNMKYRPYLFCLCFCTSLVTHAQTYTALKAGGALSGFKYNFDNNLQARITWYGGISANFDVKEQFFIRTELLYSLRGYHVPPSATTFKGNISYSYLSVPLLAGYKPLQKLSVMVGPELGYLLKAKSKDAVNNADITHIVNYRFTVDGNAGISWELTPELLVETHFLVGLTPLYNVFFTDPQGNITGSSRDGFHRVWQLGLVYKMSGH